MNPNEIQIGGDHYKKAGDCQHWDLLYVCGFGWEYYVGRATAYYSRVKHDDDTKKGGHFIDKLIHLIENGQVPDTFRTTQGLRDCEGGSVPYNKRVAVEDYLVTRYFPANGIDPNSDKATVIRLLMTATGIDDVLNARAVARRIDGEVGQPAQAPAPTAKAEIANSLKALDIAATDSGAPTGQGYVQQDGEPKA